MLESLLIANRGEIACQLFRFQILPGTGRGTAAGGGGVGADDEGRDPSVSALRCHLPVPGRI